MYMNWKQFLATEKEFKRLAEYNEPIIVSRGEIEDNAGVEVVNTTTGNKLNAVYDANKGAIRKLNTTNPVFETIPNRDLQLLNDHLLNPDVNTIVVDGFFGTGKTSTVCSHLVPGLVEGQIKYACIAKPNEGLGKTIGYLPGDVYEKTALPFKSFTQYFDRYGQPNLAMKLMGLLPMGSSGKPSPQVLELLVFEYLRGRDIDSGWVVLDESQNTDEKEMAGLIGRTGDGAKLILLGDSSMWQIDRRGNTETNNGLVFAKNFLKGKRYAGIVELQTEKHILRGKRVRDLLVALRGSRG
jgi:predicted ribonuclease YlaK